MNSKSLMIAVSSILLLSSAATAQTVRVRRSNSSIQPARTYTTSPQPVRRYTPPPVTQRRTCIQYSVGGCPGTSYTPNGGYQIRHTTRTRSLR